MSEVYPPRLGKILWSYDDAGKAVGHDWAEVRRPLFHPDSFLGDQLVAHEANLRLSGDDDGTLMVP